MITYIETIKDAIYEVRIKPGQIVYATVMLDMMDH